MADFRAIGGVSSTLQRLLEDRMELPDTVTSVEVTVGSLPASKDEPHKEEPRVVLFLYRVTENGFLQNQEIPGRGAGNGYGRPPLSLNLHYLLTAYGNVSVENGDQAMFDDTTAQVLLGSAMRVLHDVSVITDRLVTVRAPSGLAVLDESLRDQFEQVKVELEPLSLEDLTKVWTALALRYRLSAAYSVHVVQIESRRPTVFPRPVGQPVTTSPPLPGDPPSPGPWVFVRTIQTPTVTELRVRRAGETAELTFPYARVGDTLIARGTALSGPVTSVAFGDLVVPAAVARGDRVEVDVPDATLPGGGAIAPERMLQPGVRSMRVLVSDPLVPHGVASSNDAAFMLVPSVDPATVIYLPGPPRTLQIVGTRLIGPGAAGGQLIIGRSAVPTSAATGSATSQTVPVPDALPMADAAVLVSGPLLDPVSIGAQRDLQVTIGSTTKTTSVALATGPVARADIVPALAAAIHDADPADPRFGGARVGLIADRLVIVAGGLVDAITISSPTPPGLAGTLGLEAIQPAGAVHALLSGELGAVPAYSAPAPRITLTAGTSVTVAAPSGATLPDLAAALQAAIRSGGGAPAFTGALVGTIGPRLVVVPGAAGTLTAGAAPGDDTTVAELQLLATYAIRVRVSGAESTDPAVVELPA